MQNQIYGLRINKEIEKSLFKQLMRNISEERCKRIVRSINEEDKYRLLFSSILIRSIICNKLNIKNNQVNFKENEFGKPFFTYSNNLFFNISHSGKWIVAAVGENNVGIDIELIKEISFEIAKKFFSEQEYKDLIRKDEKERLYYFYDLWTLKESYIKMIGKGLSEPLKNFTIRKFDNKNITIITEKKNSRIYFKQYDIDSNYKMSVCCEKKYFPEKISKVYEIDNLIYDFYRIL